MGLELDFRLARVLEFTSTEVEIQRLTSRILPNLMNQSLGPAFARLGLELLN